MSLWTYRLLIALVLVTGFGAAAVVLSLRYIVLPDIDQHRERIASLVSQSAGLKVTIGSIEADWNGLRPHLSLHQVVVYDQGGRAALSLERVEATMSWRSLLIGQPRTHLLEIAGPNLTVRRDAEGRLSVAGLPIESGAEGDGFAGWLLDQRAVLVRDAALVWIDEYRGAPELWLKQVNIRLESIGRRHRMGITALPPPDLAAPIDLRAEWRDTGKRVPSFADWDGRLFAQLRETSLSGWEPWVDLPGGIERGTGAVRVWLDLRDGAVKSIIGDLELTDIRAQLARELNPLELESMSGRLAWRELDDGFELSAARLSLAQPGRPPTPPTIAQLRWHDGRVAGGGAATPRGELTANSLELAPWVALAEQLPVAQSVRELLSELAPRGHLSDLAIAWAGPPTSLDSWSVKGRFFDLEAKPHGAWPGVAGLTGTIDGSERGGTLSIGAQQFRLALPKVFPAALAFDSVVGQASWTGRGDKLSLRLANLAFANADLAGALSGEYRLGGSKYGFADLTGALSRVEAKAVAAYMPLLISDATRSWLATALVAGRSNEVRMRLKGDLVDYPYSLPGRDRGQFLVTVKVEGAEIDYAEGWPRLTDLDGDIVFRANRLEITPRSARMAGVRLQRVRAVIPDMVHHDEVLEVTGEAESATADFLRFIAQSPVDRLLDGTTRDMEAQGQGRLALRLSLPLRHMQDTTIAGSYQFINNRLVIDRDTPVLDTVNGRLEFTESSIRVNAATVQLWGGPASISVASQRDGTVRVNVAGRNSAENLRRELPEPWAQSLRGAADWRATINYRRKVGDLMVESSLVGLGIDLPPPFNKAAADALPMRFERVTGAQRDRLTVSVGGIVSALLLRRIDGDAPVIERMGVALGGAAAQVPERRGVSISGSLKQVDIDAWRALLRTLPIGGTGSGSLEVGEVDLRLGQAEVLGRRFNDVVLRASSQPGGWLGSIASREVTGDLAWRSQGRGRLTARLKQFNLPASKTGPVAAQKVKFDDSELPALDVTVNSFLIADTALGRLELSAQPEGRDWRIERARLSNPDATLQMEGLWQSWLSQPRTQVNLRLDIIDSGKLLARLGFPEGVRGGAGRIEGPLSWAGSPQDLDPATLNGNLIMELSKGQFLKLEPGVARLLGVFNLQNLPRRVSLDFRDLFSEGFSFDEIAGSMRVVRGIGTLDNFRIQGGSARVLMSGEINLPKETQNLQVRVTPYLGDGVALAGALIGGPIAGLASFLVQRVLKDPLAQLVSFEYAVTGTWAEPAVSRISRPEPAPSKEPG